MREEKGEPRSSVLRNSGAIHLETTFRASPAGRILEGSMSSLSAALAVLVLPLGIASSQEQAGAKAALPSEKLADLGAALERLMEQHHVPGLSAAVVYRRAVAWSKGFGYADLEHDVWADPGTRYPLASVSKPLAAVLVMQLVEQGKLSLDSPMKDFHVYRWFSPDPKRYREQPITVRHVLSHTSEGVPGDNYSYNGNTYFDLTWVLEDVTRVAYPRLLQERIFDAVGMDRSAPGVTRPGSTELVEAAQPYRWDGKEYAPGTWDMMDPDPALQLDRARFNAMLVMPDEEQAARRKLLGERFAHLNAGNTAGEVVSTVLDLAKFDAALDEGRLISARSNELMWTPMVSNSGKVLPYALGWFVEEFGGRKVMWHYGLLPPSESALYVKVPAAELSFMLLANTDGLSRSFAWDDEGVRASPFARAFLEAFGLLGE